MSICSEQVQQSESYQFQSPKATRDITSETHHVHHRLFASKQALTPGMSPITQDILDTHSGGGRDEDGASSEDIYLHVPDIHIRAEDATTLESLEDNNGYHTDDGTSELEDDKLEDSLRKQKDDDVELAKDIDSETKAVFQVSVNMNGKRLSQIEAWGMGASPLNKQIIGEGSRRRKRRKRRKGAENHQ